MFIYHEAKIFGVYLQRGEKSRCLFTDPQIILLRKNSFEVTLDVGVKQLIVEQFVVSFHHLECLPNRLKDGGRAGVIATVGVMGQGK